MPKCDKDCNTPKVLEIHNHECPVLFHRVVVPAAIGDDETNPPRNGQYRNVLLVYEANGHVYLFSSDGIPTFISDGGQGVDDYNELENKPSINGHELIGDSSLEDIGVDDAIADALEDYTPTSDLAEVALSGDYNDLSNTPTIPTVNDATLTIARNNVSAGTFTANSATDTSINIAVPTATSDLTNDSGFITNAVNNLVNYYTKAETDTAIGVETSNRENADQGLQEQIDALASASDVVDVVGTYAELQNYDTSKLGDNDIIKVLTDETHDDAISYYRWNDTTETFTYIGSQGPFYTKSETDATFVPQTRTINGKGLNSDVVLTAADVNALPASTVIPTVNDATLTIKKNGTTVTTFTANSAQNATADISVPTKVSDLTNDLDFVEESDLAPVALSGAYADLTGKPSIPTKTSDLTNDSDFVSDANYVHTDNNFTTTLKNKLNGIATGAEVNVQSDWNVTDTSSDAFIKNKPAIPTKTSDLTNDSGFITSAALPTKTSDLTNDSGFVTSSVNNLANYYTKSQTYTQSEVNSLLNAIAVPTKTSDLTNDGADGTSTYVESDDLATVATTGSYNDLSDKPDVMTGLTEMSYGESNAWAKFLAAYQAKQIVYCRASSNANPATGSQTRKAFMAYVDNAETPTNVEFQYVRSVGTKTAAQPVDQVLVYKLTSANGGTWTVQTRNMAPKLAQGTNTTVSYSNGTYTISATQPTVPTKTSDLTNDGSDGTSTYVEANELATVATTGDYDDLTNKPTIPTVNNATLTIQRNSTNVATFTANAASNVTANISVPTATSDLTNDSGFLTSSTLPVATANSLGVVQVGSGLTVSSGGVLSATGGGVADSVAWGHVTGTLADQTDLADVLAAKANSADLATVATSGSYNDLTDTPTIPSGVTLYTSLGENTDGALTQKATRELFYNDSAKSKMKIGSLGFSSDTFGSHSTSVGDLSRAGAVESTALGYNARTSGDYSIAIGSSAAIGNRSRASVIGYMSSARAVDAVALGSYALATRANEVNIGTAMGGSGYDNTQTRLLGGLHAGLLDTDAVNVGQLNSALDDKADVSDLATKQNLLSPGNHIDITNDVISATGYVHSENPQASAAASSTITGSMIANGTITADKLASDATVKLTMSTSDIGEGAPLAANTLYGVYR